MFVSLRIKSKNLNSLKQFLRILVEICAFQKLNLKLILRYFNRKSQKKIITILRSPHVNKKSQEQFEYNLTSKKLKVVSKQFFKFLVIIKKIQKIVGFEIQVVTKFTLNNTSEYNLLQNYKIKWHNSKKLSFKFLKLIELHGKHSI